jgi:hypothetical protein
LFLAICRFLLVTQSYSKGCFLLLVLINALLFSRDKCTDARLWCAVMWELKKQKIRHSENKRFCYHKKRIELFLLETVRGLSTQLND